MRSDLERWVEAGLIDPETARAIESFEAENDRSGVGRGVEAVAYLGAILILIGLGTLTVEFWDRLDPWGQFGLSLAMTIVLFVVGLLLGRSEMPALQRARAFTWALCAAAVWLTSHVAFSELVEMSEKAAFTSSTLVTLAAAAGLWWSSRSALQMVALGFTAGLSIVGIVGQAEDTPDWSFGVAMAAIGLLWFVLTSVGFFTPRRTSYAVASIGLLAIGVPQIDQMPWPVMGLVVGLALMAMSVVLEENILLGLGVAGLFLYIPVTIFELFGDSLGVPVALLLTGLVLLGLVVMTVRVRRDRG